MAGSITADNITLGDSATLSQNLVIKSNNDGTFTIERQSGEDLLTIDGSGNILATASSTVGLGINNTSAKQYKMLSHSDGRFLLQNVTSGYSPFEIDGTTHAVSSNGVFVAQSGLKLGAGTDVLSVYDEGTWTPTWTSSNTQPSLGNGTLTGVYTKIGRQITVHVYLVIGSTTTIGTGSYNLSLPFTNTSHPATGTVMWSNSGTDSYPGGLLIGSGSGVMLIYTASGVSNLPTNPNWLTTGDAIYASATYFV